MADRPRILFPLDFSPEARYTVVAELMNGSRVTIPGLRLETVECSDDKGPRMIFIFQQQPATPLPVITMDPERKCDGQSSQVYSPPD